MREIGTGRDFGLSPYESPQMRVVALDGGRTVVCSSIDGFTTLGNFEENSAWWNAGGSAEGLLDEFGDGFNASWNDGGGSANGLLGEFDDGSAVGWNAGGSANGNLLGEFGDGSAGWNAGGSAVGSLLYGFGDGSDASWNDGGSAGGGLGAFDDSRGAPAGWE